MNVFGEMNEFVSCHADTMGHVSRGMQCHVLQILRFRDLLFWESNAPSTIRIAHYLASDTHKKSYFAPVPNRLRRSLIVTGSVTNPDPLGLFVHRGFLNFASAASS